jgi:hypothetical protein
MRGRTLESVFTVKLSTACSAIPLRVIVSVRYLNGEKMSYEKKNNKRLNGLNQIGTRFGARQNSYKPLMIREKTKKFKTRYCRLNPSAYYTMMNQVNAVVDPTKVNGPVRELKDMTEAERRSLAKRYGAKIL